MNNDVRVFGLNGTKQFAEQVADFLDCPLTPHKETDFDDGEPYCLSAENVRNCDVFVIQSLYEDEESIASKFTKLLFFIGSLKDASAGRITAVIPYLGYARQDRKTESRAPIATKYVAQLLESVGAKRLITIDAHNLAAIQNAFRTCIPDNLEARKYLSQFVASDIINSNLDQEIVVLSPDSGGMERARRFRGALRDHLEEGGLNGRDIGLAYLDKRHEGRDISGNRIIGEVKGRLVIVVDDLISSGSTVRESVNAIESHESNLWGVCATHGLFVGKVNENLAKVNRLVITDTIKTSRLSENIMSRTHYLSMAKLFAQAIRRTHQGESISKLL